MEHSYSRDWRPMEGAQVMTTRTILVHRAPQCPSCHVPASDEIRVDMSDQYSPPIPAYNEEAAKMAMDECEKIATNIKNGSSEEDDWESRINKFGWTYQQNKLFTQVTKILDLDQLSRLANKEKEHEAVHRRVTVDKSVSRVRQALAGVSWDPRLTQWLHALIMDNFPSSYLGLYLDILQTLKSKVPTLVDKMVFGRPVGNNYQEIMGSVLKRPWEPCVVHKSRKLPGNAVIIVAPSTPAPQNLPSSRFQKWLSLLETMTNVIPVQMNISNTIMQKQSLSFIADQMVAACRQKIQEVRSEIPNRHIILVGLNAGASLALQVGLTEQLSSIICLGFAFNTLNGIRGEPDDRILEVKVPVLFVQGQIAARSSQEEIESLREKMQAQTSLVVVGSADDSLRVSKNKRRIEGVTQTMVDNMIMDEIFEFTTSCILNPPGPRDLSFESNKVVNGNVPQASISGQPINKKRKQSQSDAESSPTNKIKIKDIRDGKLNHVPRKVGRPRIRPVSPKRTKTSLLQPPTTEALNLAIQSIMPSPTTINSTPNASKDSTYTTDVLNNLEIGSIHEVQPKQATLLNQTKPKTIITTIQKPSATMQTIANRPMQKVKIISTNNIVQLKQAPISAQSKTFTLKTTPKVTLSTGNAPTASPHQQIITVRAPPARPENLNRPIATPSTPNKLFTVKTIPAISQSISSIQIKPQSQQQQSTTSSPLILSPTKFTIIKPTASTPINVKVSNATTTAQSKSTPDLSSTNIFDIPIVFADSDGNIQDTDIHQEIGTTPTIDPNVKQLVQNRSIVINNIVQSRSNMPNKVMVINRNQVKPVPNILSKSSTMPPLKYTKVVVSNPNMLGGLPKTDSIQKAPFKLNLTPISKVDLLNSGLIKATNATVSSTNSTSTIPTASPSAMGKYQPIVINVDSDKTTIKNMINVSESQPIKPNTIVIKPGGIRPIPIIKSGMLNRNLTVKKLNLIPQKQQAVQSQYHQKVLGTTMSTTGTVTSTMSVTTAVPKQ